ncbi:hypothetical protein [Streptomyces sp. TRM68367]|uniref:hypothetical protein n=1 Tax=Streptomyces sp. TRM68367 TaxID=2758415 RepID=UPI00165BC72D|nr:hypothetical protein [Streptomyces sp. TRM68367]MBC9723919.1 hypothetical protein [Streptomyces sp. TRM68367]
MTGIWLPLVATALAAALTWWCCIRPMAKNRACHATRAGVDDPELQEELRHAREEVRRLREQATPPAAPSKGPEILDR